MMPRLAIEMKVSEAFKHATPPVITTKSAFISFCAGIDRDFRVDCNISISEECTHEMYYAVTTKVPLLKRMTYELFEEYINFYHKVRNIVAHLYARNKIIVSKKLVEYFSSIVKPQYSVTIEEEVTIYGAAYLLLFISKSSCAWSLFTNLFKKENFLGIKSIEGQNMHKYLNAYAMTGKVKYKNGDIQPIDVTHFNSTILKNVTNIVFEIEKAAFHNSLKSYGQSSNFLDELNRIGNINNQSDIRTLRNAFFHGYYLFDNFKVSKNYDKTITFDFVISTLDKLRKSILNDEKCKFLKESIETFGKELLNYFFASFLEVSYKITDSRLLTAEKIDSRVQKTISMVERIDYYSKKYLPLICKLLPDGKITISLQEKKFIHVGKRETTTNNFRIINLKSKNGFKIGLYHTAIRNFYLVQVDLPEKFINTINEKKISDIKVKKVKDFCRLISLYSADI